MSSVEKQGGQFMSERGLFGGLFDETGEQAHDILDQNRQLYNFGLPSTEWKDIDPTLLNTESANYALSQDDPVTKSMQMQALAKLSGLADSGQSDIDAAGYDQARQLGAQQARAGTQAALQNAEARGIAGSGQEMAMREMANQGGAERAHSAALQQAADAARQRALYAQAYGSQVAGAREQDARTNQANTNIINQFNQANTAQRNKTAATNVAAQNDAARYNQEARTGLAQQNFRNQMDQAKGKQGANTEAAKGFFAQNAANQDARNQDTSTFTSMMGMFSDERAKENVSEFDVNRFLNSLTGHQYTYKDPTMGEGIQTSVMAQALEKTPEGRALVKEIDGVKFVDYGKAFGLLLASLVQLNKKVNELEGAA